VAEDMQKPQAAFAMQEEQVLNAAHGSGGRGQLAKDHVPLQVRPVGPASAPAAQNDPLVLATEAAQKPQL
jgi:hypothetical protein